MAVADLLRARRGGEVAIAEIETAVAQDSGGEGAHALQVVCAQRNREAHLVELRFALAANGTQSFPKLAALRAAGKKPRCPTTGIRVD